MGKEKFKAKEVTEKVIEVLHEEKVELLVWFTSALERFPRLKVHHLPAVQAYFSQLGLKLEEAEEIFDEALIKFGHRRI